MLKLDLILQIMNQIDRCLKEKIQKVIGLRKSEEGLKIMTKFVGLKVKSYNFLTDDCNDYKKAKAQKSAL